MVEMVKKLKAQGARIAAYGAAAKGVVLLNYCGIGPDLLTFVADRSPHKQGKRLPGVHLPVVEPHEVLFKSPDVLMVLAWNFFDEIRAQLADYEEEGGRFMIPVPEPRIVTNAQRA